MDNPFTKPAASPKAQECKALGSCLSRHSNVVTSVAGLNSSSASASYWFMSPTNSDLITDHWMSHSIHLPLVKSHHKSSNLTKTILWLMLKHEKAVTVSEYEVLPCPLPWAFAPLACVECSCCRESSLLRDLTWKCCSATWAWCPGRLTRATLISSHRVSQIQMLTVLWICLCICSSFQLGDI
jgi:hypothetical protein